MSHTGNDADTVVPDMTNLEQVAERLQEIDDPVTLLAGLFAYAPVGFQLYHADGRCLLVNEAFRDLFGSEPPPEYNVLHDEIAEAQGILDLVRRAFAGETVPLPPIWYDPRALRQVRVADGRRVAIETTVFPIFDRLGTVGHVAFVFKDVTRERVAWEEKSKIEEALRQSEASFRALFAGNPLPMWVYDIESLRFLEVNETAVRHYGYSRDEFLAMRITDIRPPDDVPRLLANVAEQRKTWEQSGNWRHRQKSGQIIDVDVTSHTLTFANRRAALVIAQDVTERKRLEAQFQQAQKMEAIGQLAGGVAHDFNNLLTTILGYCDLLLDEAQADDSRRADLEEIKKAGLSAASLTSRLLAFSRKQIVEPKILDLNTVVVDMGRMLQRLVGEDVEIEVRLTSALDLVRADPQQINQVLMNLVVNARDAMPRGGKLTIETGNADLDEHYAGTHLSVVPGPYVMLAVADTGTGMTPAVQARLFEPFFTTKEPGKGTGLGLASIYGIVKQAGGNMWVYSEVGHGTTFKMYLPRAEQAEAIAGPAEAFSPALAGTATILVVEDSDSVRLLASKILQRYGYTVLSAATADEATRLCDERRGSIQLLLTDVVMPGTGGPSLAAQLTSQHPEMRVLYMSGYTDDAIVRHGMLDGAAAFVQKPFTPDGLARKVREVLDAANGATT